MDNVIFHIYLSKEDKKRPEVLNLLSRESGNTQEEIKKYLRSHDVIEVKNMNMSRAQGVIYEFNKLGVVANMGQYAGGGTGYDSTDASKFTEGYKLGWNWWAFWFTFAWYLFKGLWVKLSVYIMIQWLLNKLPLPFYLSILSGLAFWIYLGMYANYDLHLKKDRDERLWLELPFRTWKKWYIVCGIVFLIGAVALPGVQTAKTGVYAFKTFMQEGQGVDTRLQVLPDTAFTYIPKTWWKAVDPPPGMHMEATMQRGQGEQSLKYESKKGTKLIAAICTAPPLIGVGFESIGVVAIELVKPTLFTKYSTVDDPKMVKKIINRFSFKFPLFFGWLKKFFVIEPSEPVYKVRGIHKWGRCTINKEMRIAGQEFQSPTDVYWTIVRGTLILLYTDYFPEYMGSVRGEVEQVLSSLTVVAATDISVVTEEKKLDTSSVATADELHTKGDSVPELVQAGILFLQQGDVAKAKQALQKAVNLASTENDLRTIEVLKEKLFGHK